MIKPRKSSKPNWTVSVTVVRLFLIEEQRLSYSTTVTGISSPCSCSIESVLYFLPPRFLWSWLHLTFLFIIIWFRSTPLGKSSFIKVTSFWRWINDRSNACVYAFQIVRRIFIFVSRTNNCKVYLSVGNGIGPVTLAPSSFAFLLIFPPIDQAHGVFVSFQRIRIFLFCH